MINTKSKLISVIIVNWNGKQHLEECLGSLSKQTINNFEIIFVDNGSRDGSVDFVEYGFPHTKIVRLENNMGFCKGNNIGLDLAQGEFVALLNNDTRVEPNWLAELQKEMECDPQIGICASCMINYFQPVTLDTAGDGYDICGVGFKMGSGQLASDYRKRKFIFGACAGSALYRRSMINKIGFLDENYFAVGEDIDFSFRANLAGYKCVYVPTAIVYHKINQTVGPDSDFLLYHARRNVEYTYFKNMPLPLIILTFPIHLLYNLLTLLQAIGQGRLPVFLKAKRDFLINFKTIWKKRRIIQKQRRIALIELLSSFSKNYLIRQISLSR